MGTISNQNHVLNFSNILPSSYRYSGGHVFVTVAGNEPGGANLQFQEINLGQAFRLNAPPPDVRF
jgi:hypothetical protein